MNPYAQLSASLLATLALTSGTLLGALRGEIDLPHAALRCAAAFVLARVAFGMLDRLVSGYAAALHQRTVADEMALDTEVSE